MRLCRIPLGALLVLCVSTLASAAEPERRTLKPDEIEGWLERPSGDTTPLDQGLADDAEAPPPPPRHHGVFVESGLSASGHLGTLKNISPVAPTFSLKVGIEPLRFALIFVEGELTVSNTSYARTPPPPRTYHLYNLGAGARFTVGFGTSIGAFAEGSLGFSRVSEDVLGVYGYLDANELNPYFGGRLGVEWYPTNPHLALGLGGGVRSYAAGLTRERSSEPALAWSFGPQISYRF